MKIIELLWKILEVIKQILSIKEDVEGLIPKQEKPKPTPEQTSEFNKTHLKKMLAFDEGEVLKIYKDSLGYWTVGVGHLLTKLDDRKTAIAILDRAVGRSTGGAITLDESQMMFNQDLEKVIQGVKSSNLSSVYNSLDPIRRLALMNMVFQMGVQGVANFKNSMRIAEEGSWYILESNLKKSLWYRQTTNRATRVIRVFCDGDLAAYSHVI